MSIIDNMKWRYATKQMNGQKVDQAKVDTILEAIRISASSFGLQPYKVIVIENQAVKESLVPAAWGQSQLKDCSHLLVFAAWTKVTAKDIEEFIALTARTRNMGVEMLGDYKNMMIDKIVNSNTPEQQAQWCAKQTYIALGSALLAAAELRVDATPMEGFEPQKVNEILGLTAKGLSATLIMPFGYRAEGDWLAPLAKVRKVNSDLFEFVK